MYISDKVTVTVTDNVTDTKFSSGNSSLKMEELGK